MSKRKATRIETGTAPKRASNRATTSTKAEPAFTFGIEEEYFVIDRDTGALARDLPRKVFDAVRAAIGPCLSPEYMRSQIEIATPVLSTPDEARETLTQYRRTIASVLEPFGLAPLAVATHPFADWRDQKHTNKPRYNEIADSLQGLGRRMLVNGLHVHVGIDDEDDRIRVMNGLRACLPLILAVSASSPFWQAEPTGLKSYRIAINDATPRRGIPERFGSWHDYQASIATMVRAGMIEDASHLWWDIRPSARFATVETRIADVCPRVEDSVAVSMFVRTLARALWREADGLRALSHLSLVLINENRWLAQRYGTSAGYIDATSETMKPFGEVLDDVLDVLKPDADALGTGECLEHVRRIASEGTSADRQIAVYEAACANGERHEAALRRVTEHLLDETLRTDSYPAVMVPAADATMASAGSTSLL